MNQTEATVLLKKYKAGTCTEEEKAKLESWYLQWNDEELGFTAEELTTLRNEMWAAMPVPFEHKTTRLWTKAAIAASVLIALSTGLWFYIGQQQNDKHGIRKELLASDIPPGKNTATLTLASGKTIALSDEKSGVVINNDKLAYDDGSIVTGSSSRADSAIILTAATPRGGTYRIILPDGSKVWLNAASSIKFSSDLDKLARRTVSLTGEAYFEVAKDKSRPFIVSTDKQEVEVLGTHFNINSYADEAVTKTTLLEGSVKVTAFNTTRLLSPGQQASLKARRIAVENVDIEDEIAWKNGNFVFNDEDLESIMRKISRWYDVEIYYQDRPQKPSSLGILSRTKNLSALLKVLELSGKVHFKIEGRRIIVMK